MSDIPDLFGGGSTAADPVDPGGQVRHRVADHIRSRSSADFSACGHYRYALHRRWSDGPLVLWVMLNPSTADLQFNDPTLQRCQHYSQRWGYAGFGVCNLFGLRATDPSRLEVVADPVGPDNDGAILAHAAAAVAGGGFVVCGWGTGGRLHGRGAQMSDHMRHHGIPLYALAWNVDGSPRHPLYLKRSLPPQSWPASSR